MIRVGVAGASGMLRTGLEALVRADPDMQLVFATDSLADAQGGSADVLVAISPDLDEVAVPHLPPLVVIASTAPEFVRAALRAGARSVLPQECTTTELRAALEAAAAGLTVLRGTDVDAIIAVPVESRFSAPEDAAPLSPRETEVLRLLADGLANKEIGYRLGISEHTVKFHVNSILTRLDAASRAEAVAIGIRRGLILL